MTKTLQTLEQVLRQHAEAMPSIISAEEGFGVGMQYIEHVNPDAAGNAQAAIEAGTSFVHRVGVLAAWDSNKCDEAWLLLGQQQDGEAPRCVGVFFWEQGENDDIGGVLQRFYALTQTLRHPVFHYAPPYVQED